MLKPADPKKQEVKKLSDEEIIQQKIYADSLNADKKKRDAQTAVASDLTAQIVKLREQLKELSADYNMKNRINENLGNSIASAQANLVLFDSQFREKNAERLKDLEIKLAKVDSADKELQALIKENRTLKDTLSAELGLFRQEREQNRQLVHSANTALAQNNAIWKTKEADLLEREASLAKEKAEFEEYKASLQPEIARITSIKNENILLLQKIEMQNLEMKRRRLESIRTKELADEARASARVQVEQQKQATLAEESRLRKWEQDLKDIALELSAREAEANKVLRRERLQEEVKASQAKESK